MGIDMGMYIKDNHVYAPIVSRDEYFQGTEMLVVSRYALASEIPYIMKNGIMRLDISLGNPRLYCDKEYWEKALAEAAQRKDFDEEPNYDTDISPLRECPQLDYLCLCGNIVHSEIIKELSLLRSLSIDNTLGKNKVDLSGLQHLDSLYIQKPGRNVIGFEQLSTLREVRIWNYTPKCRNLTDLVHLKNLELLDLIQPRIDTLDGIEQLPALKRLDIYRSRTLKDISALDKCQHQFEFVCEPRINR